MTTPGTTMIEELEHACNSASVLAMYASRDGAACRAQIHRAEATRLRQRYTRVRDFPRVLSGELQIPGVTTTAEMFEWLTGPIPEAETRKPLTIVRDLEAKVESLHTLAGWADVAPHYERAKELFAELRRSLKTGRDAAFVRGGGIGATSSR